MASRSIIDRCGTHCQTRNCSFAEVLVILCRDLRGGSFAAPGMRGTCCIITSLPRYQWALNSAVECHPHTVEVIGSNPIAPTINQPTLQALRPLLVHQRPVDPFFCPFLSDQDPSRDAGLGS